MASITDDEAFSGKRLRRARLRAGLNQDAVAAELKKRGIPTHQSAVSHWETGNHGPRPKTLKVLAEILGTTVDDLLGADRVGAA